MSKRTLAALVWFAAIWVGYEILWSVTGVPRQIGPIIAAGVSGFVTVDPLVLFWPRATVARQTGPSMGSTRVPS